MLFILLPFPVSCNSSFLSSHLHHTNLGPHFQHYLQPSLQPSSFSSRLGTFCSTCSTRELLDILLSFLSTASLILLGATKDATDDATDHSLK